MNASVLLAGLAIWFLLALVPVALLVAEGRRKHHLDTDVPPGEFDHPASRPRDDIEPQSAEQADNGIRPVLGFVTDCECDDAAGCLTEYTHKDHERATDQSEAE